jgi:hypothetical protein
MPVLRALIGEAEDMAVSREHKRLPKRLRLGTLTRLDYLTVQAMLMLKETHQLDIIFSELDHLKPALKRYGVLTKLLDEGALQA